MDSQKLRNISLEANQKLICYNMKEVADQLMDMARLGFQNAAVEVDVGIANTVKEHLEEHNFRVFIEDNLLNSGDEMETTKLIEVEW